MTEASAPDHAPPRRDTDTAHRTPQSAGAVGAAGTAGTLHAAWVPAGDLASGAVAPARGALLLWAEGEKGSGPVLPTEARRGLHPGAAGEAAVRGALAALAAAGHLTRALDGAGIWLPAVPLWLPAGAAGGPARAAAGPADPPAAAALRPWTVGVLALDAGRALALLLRLPAAGTVPGLGGDLRFWGLAARLAGALLAGGRYLPAFATDADGAWATWEPSFADPRDQAARAALAAAMPGAAAAATHPAAPDRLLAHFLRAVVAAAVQRWAAPAALPAPPAGVGTVQEAAFEWLLALLGPDPSIAAAPAALHALAVQYRRWLAARQPAAGTPAWRVCLRLEPPADAAPAWRLHFLLQAADDPSLLLPAAQVWRLAAGGAVPLPRPDPVPPAERLQAGLAGAARLFAPLDAALRHPAPIHATLDAGQAYAFLREAAPLLQAAGYGVLVPPWWGSRAARPLLRPRLQAPAPAGATGGAAPGLLGAAALVDFDWQVAVGDTLLDRAAFERLVALKTPLIQVRGQWVEFRPGEVEAALRFWTTQAARGPLRLGAAARLLLGADGADDQAALPLDPAADLDAAPAVAGALAVLRGAALPPELPPPPGLQATLRPYQVRGYSWLVALGRLGLGACLADDMGLGKTIQTLAFLLHARDAGLALLVCPTSVVGNWQREVARFAPALRVLVHQGPDRLAGAPFAAAAGAHDLVITSYSLLARDEATLATRSWASLVLDEAQNIKNPDAAGTRAAKRIPAGYRVALTGTPVENRLEELWSIMDFLNPGILGGRAAFRARYALPIEREGDPAAADALRRRVGPLILRRLKTDRTIIQDLPAKLERKVYCPLTGEQASLYEAVVRAGLADLGGKAGMARRGLVLRLLLQLKQITDHPALFLGDGSALPGRSGKLIRLTEMLDAALAVGDKALIFTQFAEMGTLLQAYLGATFGQAPLYLHGGTPRPARDGLVAAFQAPDGPPLLILSIKAGGVGLNLTAARHVFHFDRWWNPAVENQATDRAFRIGQRANVQVHKLIAAGTLDERIDQLIESKRALAAQVIGAGGEGALAELDDAALAALVGLDPGGDGRWTMDDGRWTMDDGRWTMDDRVAARSRRTMDDG